MADPKIINIEIDDVAVDPEVLHAELKAEFGDAVTGVSYSPDSLRATVHLIADNGAGEIAPQKRLRARAIVTAHDITKIPPKEPQKDIFQRIAELEAKVAQLEQRGGIEAQAAKK